MNRYRFSTVSASCEAAGPPVVRRSRSRPADFAVDVLLSFAAALLALRLAGLLLRGRRLAWAGGLADVRGRRGRDGLGRRARLGRAVVPRLLPRGRPALGAAARGRVAAAVGQALGRAAGLVYVGLAIGVAVAMPVHGSFAALPSRTPKTTSTCCRGSSQSPAARSAPSPWSSSRSQRSGAGRSGTVRRRRRRRGGSRSALTQTAVAAAAALLRARRGAALRRRDDQAHRSLKAPLEKVSEARLPRLPHRSWVTCSPRVRHSSAGFCEPMAANRLDGTAPAAAPSHLRFPLLVTVSRVWGPPSDTL